MATSDADKVLCSTPGRANFQRISRLLVCGGTRVLREAFDSIHPPSVLPTVLGDPVRLKQLKGAKLTKPQWDCLYLSPGVYGKSSDFDITLLSRLLRTICNLTPPPTGWDSLPTSSDHSLAADFVRIKCYRNSVYGHVKEDMEVRDDEFSSLWQDISETIARIAGNISPVKMNEWKKGMDGFLNDSLTPEDERNVQELQDWYFCDMDVKKTMEQLKVSYEEGMSRVSTGVTRKMKDVREGIKGVHEAVEGTAHDVETAVREESQDIKDHLEQVQKSVDGLSPFAGSSQPLGARVKVRIDCESIGTPGPQSADFVLTTQAHHAGPYDVSSIPIAPRQRQVAGARSFQGENVNRQPFLSTQQILNRIAEMYLDERKIDGFLEYMERVREVMVVNIEEGSLLITVECSSLEILEGLWEDYTSGHLNEVAQELLVTPEILKELGLTGVKLMVTMLKEEYEVCKQYFLKMSGKDFIGIPSELPKASITEKELEKQRILECGICLERFCLKGPNEPKMLLCQHNYCKGCLGRLVTRVGPEDCKVTCPECKRETKVPGGDVTRLQPSYLIKKFLSIDEERVICNKHKGKDIDLFCESCDQVICCVCAVIDHRDHQCTHLKEVFPAQKENIMTFVTKASANIPVLKAAIESMQEREKNVQENSKAVRREVDAFIDEHIESMERKRESLKQDLESLTSNQIKQLHDHKEFLSSILGRVEAGVQAAEQVLASENEAKVLSKKNEIIQQMNTLSLFEAPPDTRETIFCEFEAKSLLENGTVEKMATISQNGEFVLSMLGGEPGVIYTTRAEQTCHFVLTPRKKNEAAPRESDEILVNIKLPKVKSVSPDIENNEDGTYSFSYRPDDTGSYYIEILINGIHSCGSPVTWQVEPALYLPGSVLRNWPRTRRASERDDVCVFQEGQHSWKTQLILRQDGQTATDEKHQLGVIHFGGRCKSYWEEGQRFSIANDDFYKRVKASVQSFQNDDVFVCYLNIDKGQLIIYNERTQQSDTFNNLKPPISPLYYPEQNKLFKVPRARGIQQVPPRGVPGKQQPGGARGPNQRVGGMPLQDQQVRGPGPMQSRGQRPAYKFKHGVRNQPQAHPSAVPMQPKERVPQAIYYIPGQEPLNPSVLAAATSQEQKQMLGERLFPLVQSTCPELAGKITGMLLEIDNAELLHMLETREALAAKIQELVSVTAAQFQGSTTRKTFLLGQEPLNPSVLAAATPQEQKQMLGERLFPLVQSTCPGLAGKITDMLLEIDIAELLHMLESREALAAKIQETVSVIRAHNAKEKTTDMKN